MLTTTSATESLDSVNESPRHLEDFLPASTGSWSSGAAPLTLCRVALWGFLCLLVTHTSADADLWGHLRFGLDMLASKSLHVADAYSFTADRAWVNHEWLSELLMGAAYTGFGTLGLNFLKFAVVAVIGVIVAAIAKQEGARPFARDVYVGLVVFATYSRTQVIRPQMFSVAIFCVLLYLLRETTRGRVRAIWCVPVCFAAWVNLHGGWIVGLAVLGVWMLGEAWRRRTMRETFVLAGAGALAIAATLVNPYGIGLWQFLAETVRPERADVTDWKPLLQLPTAILVIESILPLVTIAALWKARPRASVPLGDVAVLIVLLVATVRVGRVDAFLQAAIAILLAAPLVAFLNGLDLRARGYWRRASLPVGAMAIILAASVLVSGASNAPLIHVEGPWIPDRDAATYLRTTHPGARVLTWFDWGEYALWQLSPAGIRVSMDGRRETVYSSQVLADHQRFYQGQADMADYPERIGADTVWLPSHFPMIARLTDRGWVTVLDTGKSAVLRRGAARAQVPRAAPPAGPNLFPWP